MGFCDVSGMMFSIKICLAYFLLEELDSPLPVKPLEMVLTLVSELCLSTLWGKVVKMSGEK